MPTLDGPWHNGSLTRNRRIRIAGAWSTLFVAVLVALVGAPAANGVAAGPAPQYDPQSPAGKEYALPLAQAREQARAEPSQERGSTTTAAATVDDGALFGKGIAPAAKPSSGSPKTPSSRSADDDEQAPAVARGPSDPPDPPGAEPAFGSKSESSEVSALVVGVLSGCGVLFLAMLLTLLIRIRPRSSTTTGAPG